MKAKNLVLFLLLLVVSNGYSQKKKQDKKSTPYMKEAPKQKTKTPPPGTKKTTEKPVPVRPKEAPKTAEELEQRRAEFRAKEALEKKEAQEKKAKALKEMSFAQELATSSSRGSSGFRIGANVLALKMDEITPARLTANGIPELVNGQVVRDAFSANGQVGIGYNVAAFFRLSKGSFYFQPELMFQSKGGNFTIKKGSDATQKISARYNSIEIPLMFGIRSRNLRFTTGPSFGYSLKANDNLLNIIKNYSEQLPETIIKKFNFGYNAGIGYEKNQNIFDFRVNLALQKPLDLALGTTSLPTQLGFSPRIFQFSYGRIMEGSKK